MPTKGYMAKYIPCKKYSVYDKKNIDRNTTCINTDCKPKKFVEFRCIIGMWGATPTYSDQSTDQTWPSSSSCMRDWLLFALSSSSCWCQVWLQQESLRSYRLGMYMSLSCRLTIASNTLTAIRLQQSSSVQPMVDQVNKLREQFIQIEEL